MNRLLSGLVLTFSFFPTVAFAGDTTAGFIMLGAVTCIPSVGVLAVCLILLSQYAKAPKPNTFLVVVLPLAYVPFGVAFTDYGAPVPLWAVFLADMVEKVILWPIFVPVVFMYIAYAMRRLPVDSPEDKNKLF